LIAIITIVFGYLGDRFHNRILFSAIPLVTATIGMALIVGLPEHRYSTLKLVSYYFGNANAQVYITFISLISSNVAG
jgi:ACS family allantoate permease-like MFS transporter